MTIPIIQLSDKSFKITVDTTIYTKDAIVNACYKFTNNYHVFQEQSTRESCIDVIFEAKNETTMTDRAIKDFCNELIDQQVRHNTNLQFGHIRDLIVEEAFKPMNK